MIKLRGAKEQQRRQMCREENERWKWAAYGNMAWVKHTEQGHTRLNEQGHSGKGNRTDTNAKCNDS